MIKELEFKTIDVPREAYPNWNQLERIQEKVKFYENLGRPLTNEAITTLQLEATVANLICALDYSKHQDFKSQNRIFELEKIIDEKSKEIEKLKLTIEKMTPKE